MNNETFESWCIVELFGHNQIAGLVTEQQIGGQSFVRVDVPEVDGKPGFTKLYGSGAIYAITPCSEEVAKVAVERLAVRPISIWMPELNRQLPPPTIDEYDEDAYPAHPDGLYLRDDYEYEPGTGRLHFPEDEDDYPDDYEDNISHTNVRVGGNDIPL